MDKKQKEFIGRIKEYVEEDNRSLKKLKLGKQLIINHTKKQKLGLVARFLMFLLRKGGYIIDTRYVNLKK